MLLSGFCVTKLVFCVATLFKVTGEWASTMLWDDGIHPSLVSLIIITAFKEFR